MLLDGDLKPGNRWAERTGGGKRHNRVDDDGQRSGGLKLWVLVAWFTSNTLITGAADGTNTYRIDVQGAGGSNETNAAIISADIPAQLNSGATITVTFGDALPADRKIAAMYSSGVATGATSDYGNIANHQGSGVANWTSTAITVTSGDILIGVSGWEDSVRPTNTPTGGNSEVHDSWNDGTTGSAATSCYQIGTGASIAAQGTWSTSSGGAGIESCAVAYAAAGGGADATVTPGPAAASGQSVLPAAVHWPFLDVRVG